MHLLCVKRIYEIYIFLLNFPPGPVQYCKIFFPQLFLSCPLYVQLSSRCKRQLNLSLIVFCDSLLLLQLFFEWILFVITSEHNMLTFNYFLYCLADLLTPDAVCIGELWLCRLFCSLVKNPLIADTSTMTFNLSLSFLVFAVHYLSQRFSLDDANCCSWPRPHYKFTQFQFSASFQTRSQLSDFLYSNENKQLHDPRWSFL